MVIKGNPAKLPRQLFVADNVIGSSDESCHSPSPIFSCNLTVTISD